MADPDLQIREGGGGCRGGHPDPEIRGGPGLQQKFLWPFRPQFGIKIGKGGGWYFRNFWVGMCHWDPGTLTLYQS